MCLCWLLIVVACLCRAVLSVRPTSGVRRGSGTRAAMAGPDWMINIKTVNTMMMVPVCRGQVLMRTAAKTTQRSGASSLPL